VEEIEAVHLSIKDTSQQICTSYVRLKRMYADLHRTRKSFLGQQLLDWIYQYPTDNGNSLIFLGSMLS